MINETKLHSIILSHMRIKNHGAEKCRLMHRYNIYKSTFLRNSEAYNKQIEHNILSSLDRKNIELTSNLEEQQCLLV